MTIPIVRESNSTTYSKPSYAPELEILKSNPATSSDTESAELTVRFSCLDDFYVTLLTRILRSLPELLDVLTADDFLDRIRHLARAHLPIDWKVERDVEIVGNGFRVTEAILKTVPMLTADEVLSQLETSDVSALEGLHRFQYGSRVFYPADQFGSDGRPLPVYRETLDILRHQSKLSDWDRALWWINSTGWLSGFAPRDLLLDTPDKVRDAAEQQVLSYDH